MVDAASLSFAFASGIFLLLSPCGIPMLPAFLAYYLGGAQGAGSVSGGAGRSTAVSIGRGFVGGVVASAGALSVLGVVVALGVVAGAAVKDRFIDLELVGGILVIGLGLWFISGRDLAFAVPVKASGKPGILGLYAFGGLYALVASGCSFAIVLGVVVLAVAAPTFLGSVAVFGAFGLGFTLLLVIVTVAAATASQGVLSRIRSVVPYLKRGGGAVMVAIGLYLIYYWWQIPR